MPPSLTLFTGPFSSQNPFWKLLEMVAKKSPESTIIITPNPETSDSLQHQNPFLNQLQIYDLTTMRSPFLMTDHYVLFRQNLARQTSPLANQLKRYNSTLNAMTHTYSYLEKYPDLKIKPEYLPFFPKKTAPITTHLDLKEKTCFWIGFAHFSPLERDLFHSLVSQSDTHSFLLHYDANNPIYDYAKTLYTFLATLSFTRVVPFSATTPPLTPTLSLYDTPPLHLTGKSPLHIRRPVQTLLKRLEEKSLPPLSTTEFSAIVLATLDVQPHSESNTHKKMHQIVTHLEKKYNTTQPYSTHIDILKTYIGNSLVTTTIDDTNHTLTPTLTRAHARHLLDIRTPATPKLFLDTLSQKKLALLNFQAFTYHCLGAAYLTTKNLEISLTQDPNEDHLPDVLATLYRLWGLTPEAFKKHPTPPPLPAWPVNLAQSPTDLSPKPMIFSATQLETYQQCPYVYFLRYDQKNYPPDPPLEDISSHQWGQQLHAIVHKITCQPFTLEEAQTYTLQHLSPLSDQSIEWQLKAFEFSENILPKLWPLLNDPEFPFKFTDFESEFLLTLTHPEHATPLTIKGRFDALLTHRQTGERIIFDYKSGKEIPSKADIEQFRKLQMGIYMLALEQLHPQSPIAGALYLQIHDEDHLNRTVAIYSENAKSSNLFNLGRKQALVYTHDWKTRLIDHLFKLKTWIEEKRFDPLSPHLIHMQPKRAYSCTICDYKRSCTYDHRFG